MAVGTGLHAGADVARKSQDTAGGLRGSGSEWFGLHLPREALLSGMDVRATRRGSVAGV